MILLLALGCEPKAPPAPVLPPPVVLEEPSLPEGTTDRMVTHFGLGANAQQALIVGDVAGARSAGAALAALPPLEGLSVAWREDFDALQARASDIAAATDMTQAAAAVATLGQACGACHAREGRGPRAPVDELGSARNLPEGAMDRHQWATTWMWLGIIGADNAAYDAGLDVLAQPPTWDPRSNNTTYAALQAKLSELSRRAIADRSVENRVQVYGEVLGTCAACHARVGP